MTRIALTAGAVIGPDVTESIEIADSWSPESYAAMARHYLPMAGRLVERTGVQPDEEVLDVACGTGNVTITAARRDARVTGLDVTPAMLERARENARVADVDDVTWREGDATDLPFEADAFDVTLSNLGHMYGDPPEAAARELCRVTRPGGRVGFTAWTPTSLFPELAGVLMAALPPAALPAFSEPPFAWGDPDVVRDRLDGDAASLEFETETVAYPAQSPAHFWREVSTHSAVFADALAVLDDDERADVAQQCTETVSRYFDGWENAVVLEYLVTEARIG